MVKLVSFLRMLTVEPLLFLFMVTVVIKLTITPQVFQDKICINDLKLPIEVCRTISETKDPILQKSLSKIIVAANTYTVYGNVILTASGLFYSLFIGAWTDKYSCGRKLLMVCGALGITLDCLLTILNMVYFDWPTPWLLVSSVPSVFFGGSLGLITAVHSYAAVETPDDLKTIRFAVLELTTFASSPLAQLLSGYWIGFEPWFAKGLVRNYTGVFAFSTVTSSLALLWAIFVIKVKTSPSLTEKSPPDEEGSLNGVTSDEKKNEFTDTWSGALKNLFDWNFVRTMFAVSFKKRPQQKRTQIMMLAFVHVTLLIVFMGTGLSVMFGFVQKVLHWNYPKYTRVSSLFTVVNIVSTMTLVSISTKVLNLKDTTIMLIGALSTFAAMNIRGTIMKTTGLYLSYVAGVAGMATFVATHSMISKVIDKDETGSVFALFGCFGALVPLISSVVFTSVFKLVIDWAPGIVWHFAAVMCVPAIAVIAWVDVIRVRYETTTKDEVIELELDPLKLSTPV